MRVQASISKDNAPPPRAAGTLQSFIDFDPRNCPSWLYHDPRSTFTVEADGKTYVGCRTEQLDEGRLRLWLVGGPERIKS